MKVAVLGAGAWGTALAISLSSRHAVTLWGRDGAHIDTLLRERINARYLPEFPLPDALCLTSDLAQAIRDAELIVVVVPTSGFRALLFALTQSGNTAPLVWASKGFEPGGAKLLHQVAAEVLPGHMPRGVLSGPSFAQEVARGLPCALTLAAQDAAFAQDAAAWLHHHHVRVYSSTDVVGVELGGAVKNVMAIAAGISDGMGSGYNARAALITRGLAELARLAVALGGRAETVTGLSGLGDLLLTCTGPASRNYSLGFALGQGRALAEVLAGRSAVTEGVATAPALLARAGTVDLPICRAVAAWLEGRITLAGAIAELLARRMRDE